MFYPFLPKIYSNTISISIALTQQDSSKWIGFGWPDSQSYPASCTFLFHFHWKQTSFLQFSNGIRNEKPKEIR